MKNEPASTEEQIISELVDEIYQAEAKITDITTSQSDVVNDPRTVKIETLKRKEKELTIKLTEIEENYNKKISQCNEQLKMKEKTNSEIMNEIAGLKGKIAQFNPLGFKSMILSKYVLSRTEEFLSSEQIEEIVTAMNQSDDNIIEVQKTKKDIEHSEAMQISLKKQIDDTKMKLSEIENIMYMMKEEKISIKEELINLISQKESLEEIVKLSIINMSSSNVNGKRSFPLNNSQEKAIELFSYEINHIDLNKVTNAICDGIMEIVESSNQSNNVIMELNIGEVRNGSQSNVSNTSNEPRGINREYLEKIIKEEISNFNKSIKVYVASPVNSLITSLANIIINSILSYDASQREDNHNLFGDMNLVNFNTNITSQSLSYYLICVFKVFYYESLIESKITFTTKEYKVMKKEASRQIEILHLNITKLTTKLEDNEAKCIEMQNKLKVLNEQSEKNKQSGINFLSQSEKNYIEISSKGNIVLKRKEDIDNEIKLLKEQIASITKEKENEAEIIKKEQNDTKLNIETLQNEAEASKLKSNEEIIQLRKQIADKFNIIKTQLQLYKQKHGSNLDIYNKLIDSINTTIKSTYTKKPMSTISTQKNFFYENSIFHSERKKHRNRSLMNDKLPNNDNDDFINDTLTSKRASSNSKPQYQINKMSVNIDKTPIKNNNNITTVQTNNFNISGHHRTNSAISKTSSQPKNDTLNSSTNIWIEEREKLAKTIQNLKETISNLNNNPNNISSNVSYRNQNTITNSKISPLTQITFCYYRMFSSSNQKFNPLLNVSTNTFTSPPLNFIKGTLCLNKSFTIIHISPSMSLNSPIEIPIETIDNTIVNSNIKRIIEIHREYRKIKSTAKQIDLEQFAERDTMKQYQMTKAEIIKSATNKNYNFSLLVNKTKRIEFVLGSYNDFKTWINGIAYLIKNKAEILNANKK